jgi:hypothetical protein
VNRKMAWKRWHHHTKWNKWIAGKRRWEKSLSQFLKHKRGLQICQGKCNSIPVPAGLCNSLCLDTTPGERERDTHTHTLHSLCSFAFFFQTSSWNYCT